MDKTQAEVFYWVFQFNSEHNQWDELCEFLKSKGLDPEECAKAFNSASSIGRFVDRLQSKDFQ